MDKETKIFKVIDEFIFKQMDSLKSSLGYQKFLDNISLLNDNQQKAVGQSISIGLIFLPFFIAIFFLIGNISTRSEIDLKRDIISEINNLKTQTSYLSLVGNQLSTPYTLKDKADFERRLVQLLNARDIDAAAIQVTSFKEERNGDEIVFLDRCAGLVFLFNNMVFFLRTGTDGQNQGKK